MSATRLTQTLTVRREMPECVAQRRAARRAWAAALGVVTLTLEEGCSAWTTEAPPSPAPPFSFTLSVPSESSKEKLILFVHGFFGDPSLTWTNRSGPSWPDLVERDEAFRDFAVGRAGYDTPLLAQTSGVEEVATRLLRQLEDRGVFRSYKEIYFITHSMGGLVAKRILVDLNRPSQVEKLRRVKAVLYISTPAQGANIAELGSWLSLNPQLRDMRPADLNSFLQSLENQWQNLVRDRGPEHFPLSFCAYETKPTYGIHVVSRVYAATSCDQNPFPVDADHGDIVKPASTEAHIYAWARARVQEAADLARRVPREEPRAVEEPWSGQRVGDTYGESLVNLRVRFSEGGILHEQRGTGFVISEDGFALTAAYLVPEAQGIQALEIRGSVGVREREILHPLTVIRVDREAELALLRLPDRGRPWRPVRIGNSNAAAPGANLFVLGFRFPFRSDLPHLWMNQGYLIHRNAEKGRWSMSISLSTSSGGSPVLDTAGRAVAIVLGGRVDEPSPSFAVPINHASFLLSIASPSSSPAR